MHRWKQSALAAAVLATTGFYHANALALALGPLTVQSALGEPLRAEIALPQITAEEANTLRAQLADPEVFRRHGFEYGAAAANIQIQLHNRPEGKSILRLRSERPLSDPFIDVVIDASWSSGQLTRSYTLLLDPPAAQKATHASPITPQVPSRPPVVTPAITPKAISAAPTPTQLAANPSLTSEKTVQEVIVQPGEMAGKIADQLRPSGVSLDQMLVALLRSNPEAFIQGNVNRLRSGSVLRVPSTEEIESTPSAEARKIISAQARNFNEFRRKLAASIAKAETEATSRVASGMLQSQVEESLPQNSTPDRLTLSKGGLTTTESQKEEVFAETRQSEATSAREQEIARNLEALQNLSAAAAASATPSNTTAPEILEMGTNMPSLSVSAPSTPVPSNISEVTTPASVSTEESSLATPPAENLTAAVTELPTQPEAAKAPPQEKPKPNRVSPSPPQPEESLLDTLLADPLIPMAGGGILLLLLAYLAYNAIRKRKGAQKSDVDSTFFESRLQPDSFFGSSGGQRVDTGSSDSTGAASSMVYSPSQLDAGGDVDPVAEADVYLAYGRDLQAEEILKEALRQQPDRVAIHTKLSEIYAKRQDRRAFEQTAQTVKDLTQGLGPDWQHIADLGRRTDPDNALYHQSGLGTGLTAAGAFGSALSAHQEATDSQDTDPASLPSDLDDIDLDLNLAIGEDALTEAPPQPLGEPQEIAQALAPVATSDFNIGSKPAASSPIYSHDNGLAFDSSAMDLTAASTPTPGPAFTRSPDSVLGDLTFEVPTGFGEVDTSVQTPESDPPSEPETVEPLSFDLELPPLSDDTSNASTEAQPANVPSASETPDSGLMEFDLSDLSMDLTPPANPEVRSADAIDFSAPAPAAEALSDVSTDSEDALGTKLALAQEFHAIGDSEGARALIEEVVAEAEGALRLRAQRMLSELDA